jgi:hypothetical protein
MDYGVITEQGDLGLGFNEISEEEAAQIKQQEKENELDSRSCNTNNII